jgi:hypothetical protein
MPGSAASIFIVIETSLTLGCSRSGGSPQGRDDCPCEDQSCGHGDGSIKCERFSLFKCAFHTAVVDNWKSWRFGRIARVCGNFSACPHSFRLTSDCFRSFCDSSLAEVACVSSGADPLWNQQQIGRSFAIVSASGTLHPPHADANGMSTFLLIHEGLKYMVIGVYEEGKNMPNLPNPRAEGLWSLLKMPGLRIVAFVAGCGDVA